jgi:hypothetical protein
MKGKRTGRKPSGGPRQRNLEPDRNFRYSCGEKIGAGKPAGATLQDERVRAKED